MSEFQTSSVVPTAAPAFTNASSSKLALKPALCSTMTSKPSFLICSTVFGVAATRVSPFSSSLGTPISILTPVLDSGLKRYKNSPIVLKKRFVKKLCLSIQFFYD